jgi:N-acetylmuramoyl-L-alanine amidase
MNQSPQKNRQRWKGEITMKSIYLSPSTQENNIGAGDYGTEEKRMNQLTDLIEPLLKEYGLKVYRNRPEMTLKQVVDDSNAKKPDVHLAIHSNAANKKARGAEVFCHKFGGEGEKLARSVYTEVSAITPTADRGVKQGYDFYGPGKHLYELAYTKVPAALVEVAFHDNEEDARWIIENMDNLARAIVRGVLNYFGIAEKPLPDPVDEYKKIIQERCGFTYPEGVWEVINKHPYALALYKKWADSYVKTTL